MVSSWNGYLTHWLCLLFTRKTQGKTAVENRVQGALVASLSVLLALTVNMRKVSSFDYEIKPGWTVMSNSFLHSCRIILYNVLLALFRCNKWSLCLLRWWHDLEDNVAEATPCRRRLMAAIISPFPFLSLLLVSQMSNFPMSPERLPGCSFILSPLEPLQWNDIIWPCQIWWNLFLSKWILVHVVGQESSGWISSLWLIIKFPLIPTLGNPFLTVFFATMQPCVGADLKVKWLMRDVWPLGRGSTEQSRALPGG